MKELILEGKETRSRIIIERGLCDKAAEHAPFEETVKNVCIITDHHVEPLYLARVSESFQKAGQRVISHIVPAGEEYKNLASVSRMYEVLADHGFGRQDMVVALGGGVIGDMAGFAAATYMRGMKHLMQIPTTLLSQVDSSVGGKCGVDLPQGKNLVGVFRQPDVVLIDPDTLATLSDQVFASGMAEVIKYGCIKNPQILEDVSAGHDRLRHESNRLQEIIAACVDIKRQVVEEDERESGPRKILNFGHTVAHGIEKLGHYTKLSHGEAVAVGMVAALRMGEAVGITKKGCVARVTEILKSHRLPTTTAYPLASLFSALMSDKKKQGDIVSFIFIEDFGKAVIKELSTNELKEMLKVIGVN